MSCILLWQRAERPPQLCHDLVQKSNNSERPRIRHNTPKRYINSVVASELGSALDVLKYSIFYTLDLGESLMVRQRKSPSQN
jgi:hypothetical protein